MSTSTTVIIVVAIYLVAVFITGMLAGKKKLKGEEGFYTGDREFGFWSTTMSTCATDSSGWVFIGAAGFAFAVGASALWMLPGFIIGYWLNWFVVGPKLRRQTRKIGALGVVDFLHKRLDGKTNTVRVLSSLIVVLFFIPYMASQLTAAGKTISVVVGFDYNLCLIFSAVFVCGYCFFGGYRSVIWTDTVQGTIMLCVLFIFPIFLIFYLGGFNEFFTQAAAIDPMLTSIGFGATGSALAGLILGYIFYGIGTIGQPHILQRFVSVKDAESIKKGSWIAMLWVCTMMAGSNIVGIAGRILLPDVADPEFIFPAMITSLFPAIIAGIVVGAIFAAIQSTYSSQLLVAVQAIASDLMPVLKKNYRHDDQAAVRNGRITMMILGAISIILALLNLETVMMLVVYAWSVFASSFAPVLVMVLVAPSRINKWGAVAGLLVGAIVASVWYALGLSSAVFETFPGMVASFIAMVAVTAATKKICPSPEKI